MNHLRMCESVDTRLSIATPAFQHPRIIKSPPESLGTRLAASILFIHALTIQCMQTEAKQVLINLTTFNQLGVTAILTSAQVI